MARKRPQLLVDAGHVALVSADGRETFWRVAFADVVEVVAFKRDMFTTDLVCVGFRTGRPESAPPAEPVYHECDEEMPGWAALHPALLAHFGSAPTTGSRPSSTPPSA